MKPKQRKRKTNKALWKSGGPQQWQALFPILQRWMIEHDVNLTDHMVVDLNNRLVSCIVTTN